MFTFVNVVKTNKFSVGVLAMLLKRKCDVILPKMAEPVIDRFAMA